MGGLLNSRTARVSLAVAIGVVAAGFLLVHRCASGGAMGSIYRTCDCRGFEWVISDQLASDGPRRTTCLGFVSARTCYQSREGSEIPCSGP